MRHPGSQKQEPSNDEGRLQSKQESTGTVGEVVVGVVLTVVLTVEVGVVTETGNWSRASQGMI